VGSTGCTMLFDALRFVGEAGFGFGFAATFRLGDFGVWGELAATGVGVGVLAAAIEAGVMPIVAGVGDKAALDEAGGGG
jgi:hypothetical protein